MAMALMCSFICYPLISLILSQDFTHDTITSEAKSIYKPNIWAITRPQTGSNYAWSPCGSLTEFEWKAGWVRKVSTCPRDHVPESVYACLAQPEYGKCMQMTGTQQTF